MGELIRILMSSQNPSGWRLEDLLAQVRGETEFKSVRIANDPSDVAQLVYRNTARIIGLLANAEKLQRENHAALSRIAPDPGPLGKPRIGLDIAA